MYGGIYRWRMLKNSQSTVFKSTAQFILWSYDYVVEPGCPPKYYIDDSLLGPSFDYDFTGKVDATMVLYKACTSSLFQTGLVSLNNGRKTLLPSLWKCYALKVLDR